MGYASFTECTSQVNDFELNPTVNMETRHPVEDHLVVNFRRSITIGYGLKSQDVGKILVLRFWGKFSKIFPERFIAQISWNWPTGNRKVVRYLPDKRNFAWLSSSRYCADRAQNLPGSAPDNIFKLLQISPKSVHFRRRYTRTREHHQNGAFAIFGWSLASSGIIKQPLLVSRNVVRNFWAIHLWTLRHEYAEIKIKASHYAVLH